MRFTTDLAINAQPNATNQSYIIPTPYVLSGSAQAVVTGSGAAGTLKFQFSNDIVDYQYGKTPTNWSDITSATVAVSGAATLAIQKFDTCYRWIRLLFTSTATGVQTVVPGADTASNTNSKYWFISSTSGTNYTIYNNVGGAGVDPAIAGRTSVPVPYAANATAGTIGAAIVVALNAIAGTPFSAAGTTTVTITNSAAGGFTPLSDVNTGWTFATTTPTGTMTASVEALGA